MEEFVPKEFETNSLNSAKPVDILNLGVLELRTGPRPASADDEATGTLLMTFRKPRPESGGTAGHLRFAKPKIP